MSYLVRSRDWYLGWMSIYGAEESAESGIESQEKLEQRRKIAFDLVNTIAQRQFLNETFEALAQVLDHEGFHLSVQKRRNSTGSPSRGLEIEATSKIVNELLSECLFSAINPETPYQRELQLRAVLSGLVLQQAQAAEAVQAEHHDQRRNQLKKLHRDVQNQRPPSGEFTSAVFREYQSSFLVVAISEYAINTFIRAEPLAATLFRTVINAIAAGVFLAVASTTVSFFSTDIKRYTDLCY
jgi:bifunctional DNase/RNase